MKTRPKNKPQRNSVLVFVCIMYCLLFFFFCTFYNYVLFEMTVCVSVDAYVSNQGIKWFSFLPWPDLYGQSVHSHGIAHVCKCLRVRYCKAASRPGCVLDVIDRSWKLNFQPIACTAASPETKSLCCKIMRFCLVIKPHVHGK